MIQTSPSGALGGPWGDLGNWASLNWGQRGVKKGAKGEPEGGPDLMCFDFGGGISIKNERCVFSNA